jgi:ribosome-associated protein
MDDLEIAPDVVIPAQELSWRAVRSSGPGGQNVNKVSTKVELTFDLNESLAISEMVKARLRRLAAGCLSAEGQLVVTCQETRFQGRNLERAREALALLVQRALVVPKRRQKTKPTRASKARRVAEKRHQASKKQRRTRVDDDT